MSGEHTKRPSLVERLRAIGLNSGEGFILYSRDGDPVLSFEAAADIREAAATITDLLEALEGIKWRSDDKDNMEFAARITCFQMDKIRAALLRARGE